MGLESPPRFLKLQSLIAGVKTPCIGVFFISLESYQSVHVEMGLHGPFGHFQHTLCIVVTYEIRVFFEGAQKEVFSSILKYDEQAELKLCPNL
jgi:hypothetical protein